MILNLFRRAPRIDTIAALYGAIVAQARKPVFYTAYGVPDTANGRLEMIVLHAVLVLFRLENEGESSQRHGQMLFDHFCSDMDANLREMGVGDMAVPRKMKAIAEAFYGRKRAYQAAMALSGPEALVAAITRNVDMDAAHSECPQRLATYMRAAVRKLGAVDGAALLSGQVEFPDPGAFVAAESGGVGAA
jgi:cytochrome b pre-mRNA-processing protein 3